MNEATLFPIEAVPVTHKKAPLGFATVELSMQVRVDVDLDALATIVENAKACDKNFKLTDGDALKWAIGNHAWLKLDRNEGDPISTTDRGWEVEIEDVESVRLPADAYDLIAQYHHPRWIPVDEVTS